jgi:hypothetical protein
VYKVIKRALEAYTWRAIYDEKSYHQETEENCFADVDQSRVIALLLIPLQENRVPHRVDIPRGAQAVFFRRRTLEINPLSGQEYDRPSISCIGWKSDESEVYLFVLADGSTLLSSDLQAV